MKISSTNVLISMLFILFCYSCSKKLASRTDQCETLYGIMMKQQDAWNKGDVDAFMQGYWESDSLQFIGKSGITLGYQSTLENYKRSYPNQDAMGRLVFNNIDCDKLSDDHHYIVGKWMLYRTNDTLQGHYSLLWKNINGRWVIVRDHSS